MSISESGYNSLTPNGFGLFGVIKSGFTTSTASSGTLIGVTRGGVRFVPGLEIRNVGYDGQIAPTKGLDRIVRSAPQITGTFLQVNNDNLIEIFEPGGATPETLETQGTFLASGDYITNLAIQFKRSDGSWFGWCFASALCVSYEVTGQGSDGEVEVAATFEARLAQGATPDELARPVEFFEIAAA